MFSSSSASDSSITEAFYPYLLNNFPVLIKNVGNSWPIFEFFCKQGLLDDAKLNSIYGNQEVPVDLPNANSYKDNYNKTRINLKFKDFIARVLKRESLYCKDWHIALGNCSTPIYSIPLLFRDDWLNWYLSWRETNSEDDYCFAYLGGFNTMTHTHHDVLCSYSWSVNISGRKRWTFWQPADAKYLTSNKSVSIYSSIICSDAREGEYVKEDFPFLESCKCFVIEQGVGEAVFVPSGWYHMVENLGVDYCTCDENHTSTTSVNVLDRRSPSDDHHDKSIIDADTSLTFIPNFATSGDNTDNNNNTNEINQHKIFTKSDSLKFDCNTCNDTTLQNPSKLLTFSINHNWINGFAIYEMWRHLLHDLEGIRYELWHLREGVAYPPELAMSRNEWFHHCEVLLEANCSLNMLSFLEMISSRILLFYYCLLENQHSTCLANNKNIASKNSLNEENDEGGSDASDTSCKPVGNNVGTPPPLPLFNNEMDTAIWRLAFCPSFDCEALITDLDRSVVLSLLAMPVDSPPDRKYFLSTYHIDHSRDDDDSNSSMRSNKPSNHWWTSSSSTTSNHTAEHDGYSSCQESKFKAVRKFEVLLNVPPIENSGADHVEQQERCFCYPMSGLEYCLLQVFQIIEEIRSSESLQEHLQVNLFKKNASYYFARSSPNLTTTISDIITSFSKDITKISTFAIHLKKALLFL